jgi:hypothetical protein
MDIHWVLFMYMRTLRPHTCSHTRSRPPLHASHLCECFPAASNTAVACEVFHCAVISGLWHEVVTTEGRRPSSKQGGSEFTVSAGQGGLGAEIGVMAVGDERRRPPADGRRPGTRPGRSIEGPCSLGSLIL